MSTTPFVIAAPAARLRMPEGLAVAPVAQLPGSESVYATAGNPGFGIDAVTTGNDIVRDIVRARDAKQAAPPRGELR